MKSSARHLVGAFWGGVRGSLPMTRPSTRFGVPSFYPLARAREQMLQRGAHRADLSLSAGGAATGIFIAAALALGFAICAFLLGRGLLVFRRTRGRPERARVAVPPRPSVGRPERPRRRPGRGRRKSCGLHSRRESRGRRRSASAVRRRRRRLATAPRRG